MNTAVSQPVFNFLVLSRLYHTLLPHPWFAAEIAGHKITERTTPFCHTRGSLKKKKKKENNPSSSQQPPSFLFFALTQIHRLSSKASLHQSRPSFPTNSDRISDHQTANPTSFPSADFRPPSRPSRTPTSSVPFSTRSPPFSLFILTTVSPLPSSRSRVSPPPGPATALQVTARSRRLIPFSPDPNHTHIPLLSISKLLTKPKPISTLPNLRSPIQHQRSMAPKRRKPNEATTSSPPTESQHRSTRGTTTNWSTRFNTLEQGQQQLSESISSLRTDITAQFHAMNTRLDDFATTAGTMMELTRNMQQWFLHHGDPPPPPPQ